MRKLFITLLMILLVAPVIAGEYQKENREFEAAFSAKSYAIAAKLATTDVGRGNALNAQGYQEYMAGNLAAAKKLYEESIAADPLQYWAYNNLGVVLVAQGNVDEALPLFRKSIEVNEAAPDKGALARANKARKNLKEAAGL